MIRHSSESIEQKSDNFDFVPGGKSESNQHEREQCASLYEIGANELKASFFIMSNKFCIILKINNSYLCFSWMKMIKKHLCIKCNMMFFIRILRNL